MEAASNTSKVDLVVIDDAGVDGGNQAVPTPLQSLSPSADEVRERVAKLRDQVASLEKMFQPVSAPPPPSSEVVEFRERVAQLEKMFQPVSAPPPSSSEIVELRERVEKSEKMFQKACRAAREAELRAERAEFLLDTKRDVLESTKAQLAAHQKEKDLTQEKHALTEEVGVMKRNIQSMREKSNFLAGRVTALTEQLEDERSIGKEQREIYRERIDDLSKELAQYKYVAQQRTFPVKARQVSNNVHPEVDAPPTKIAKMEVVDSGTEQEHREVGAPPEKMARIVEVTVKKGMPKKKSIPLLREAEMRRALTGDAGEHALGLLLGRNVPVHERDMTTYASSDYQNFLLLKVNSFKAEKAGHKLNAFLNTPRFVCVCGANIQCAVSLFTHFTTNRHIKKRVYPVYQSDVDFWINTIDKLKTNDNDSPDIVCLN